MGKGTWRPHDPGQGPQHAVGRGHVRATSGGPRGVRSAGREGGSKKARGQPQIEDGTTGESSDGGGVVWAAFDSPQSSAVVWLFPPRVVVMLERDFRNFAILISPLSQGWVA